MRKIFLITSLLVTSVMAASAAVITGTYTVSTNGATVTNGAGSLTSPVQHRSGAELALYRRFRQHPAEQ